MPDSFDKQLAVADVYAQSLFELAQERGQVDDVRQELDELVALAKREGEFERFLSSGALLAGQREASLEKMFRGKLSDLTLNTLLVMNQHGRAGLLGALSRTFQQRSAQAANEVEAEAVTAIELSDEQKAQIVQAAAKLSGKKPLMSFVVNQDIIGGLILRIGDLRYDNSIRRQLSVAGRRLAERGSRGLEVGVGN